MLMLPCGGGKVDTAPSAVLDGEIKEEVHGQHARDGGYLAARCSASDNQAVRGLLRAPNSPSLPAQRLPSYTVLHRQRGSNRFSKPGKPEQLCHVRHVSEAVLRTRLFSGVTQNIQPCLAPPGNARQRAQKRLTRDT